MHQLPEKLYSGVWLGDVPQGYEAENSEATPRLKLPTWFQTGRNKNKINSSIDSPTNHRERWEKDEEIGTVI